MHTEVRVGLGDVLQFEMQLRCSKGSTFPSLRPFCPLLLLTISSTHHTQNRPSTEVHAIDAIKTTVAIPSLPTNRNKLIANHVRCHKPCLPCLASLRSLRPPAIMNTPYFRGSNEENAMATSPLAPPNTSHATPNRRVLGDVSTNPRVYSSPATGGLFSKKVMMGSPLKRSFTAAVEDGYGLKYLKRRRMSGELGFGPVEQRVQRARREDNGVGTRARSVPEPAAVSTYDRDCEDWFWDLMADERVVLDAS
jgi:hypothetical protein